MKLFRQYKRLPILNYNERLKIVSNLKNVSEVIEQKIGIILIL